MALPVNIHQPNSSKSQKDYLIDLLNQECRLWSYDIRYDKDIPDDILIEKVMVYLDLQEIDMLFKLFSFQKIKRVWLDRLIPQEDYLYSLNRFFAWYYFGAKRPDAYIKSMATRHFNKMIA